MADFLKMTKSYYGFRKGWVYLVFYDEEKNRRVIYRGDKAFNTQKILDKGIGKYFEPKEECAICGELHEGIYIADKKQRKIEFTCLLDKLLKQ